MLRTMLNQIIDNNYATNVGSIQTVPIGDESHIGDMSQHTKHHDQQYRHHRRVI